MSYENQAPSKVTLETSNRSRQFQKFTLSRLRQVWAIYILRPRQLLNNNQHNRANCEYITHDRLRQLRKLASTWPRQFTSDRLEIGAVVHCKKTIVNLTKICSPHRSTINIRKISKNHMINTKDNILNVINKET